MNKFVLFGLLCFLGWATFSSWYYVNYIKDLSSPTAAVPTPTPVGKVPVIDSASIEKPKLPAPEPIQLTRQFLFEKDATTPRNPEKITAWLDSLKTALTTRSIDLQIVGHTCDLGSTGYNAKLGKRRAEFIQSIFEKKMTLNSISVTSKGETEPLVTNTNESNRKRNRRVVIQINSLP